MIFFEETLRQIFIKKKRRKDYKSLSVFDQQSARRERVVEIKQKSFLECVLATVYNDNNLYGRGNHRRRLRVTGEGVSWERRVPTVFGRRLRRRARYYFFDWTSIPSRRSMRDAIIV